VEPKAPPRINPLVELRSAGRRPPLFLVHAAGGVIHDYVNLAERLDPDQPLYAFQSPGIVAGGELFATVPEMAARYREAVRAVQPRGPYRLGGYCVGGAVAFEMARQLRAEGEEVEDLVLIDSPGPLPVPAPPPGDDADMLASFVRAYGNGVEVAADELRALPPEEWIDRVVARAREMGIVGEAFDAGQLRRRWEVMRSNVHAIAAYVPAGPLPLGAVLFRATQGDAELRAQPVLGWERWLEGAIEVVDVEGGHMEVFEGPALDTLVQGLRGLRVRTAVDAAI
jgi:thioesterase domain-containing protein